MSPRIALGLAALGRPGYLNVGHGDDLGSDLSVAALRARSFAVLDAAWADGVRWFDAARSYGRAEEFLGGWLRARGIAPGDVTVSSKWGYTYTAGWQVDADPPEVKELTLEQFRRQWEESRALLGDHVDLYQIHSATIDSGVFDDAPLLAALGELRDGGVEVGLSTSGADQGAAIDRARELEVFSSVQSTWNLIERSAGDALERAHASGMRVMVKEALANGRLTARGDTGFGDAEALAGVLARPWVDVVLSGAATVEQLRSNLRAPDVEWTDELERRASGLVEEPGAYWARRGSMAWT
ncbi:MAG: aldo/keto reductase [Actinomycetota bacterium]|nr:aldo/keto reductase [Actinomycetota bacterium]